MNVIEIRDLTKYYGTLKALDKISLSVKKGEVLGFIGPNGAGKTTTVRILLGLLKKSAGKVRLFDMDAWEDSVEIHKKIAYVPGDVHLWPNLTGGEVIDLFARLRGSIDMKKKVELLKMFDLDPSKKCSTYSKGNRQKVGLISAFISDAELFILDEPTSGLDPLMASLFQDHVINLKNEGKTVFMSSHILADVEKLCDRVVIIRKGQIVQTGSLSDMRHMTQNSIEIETLTQIGEKHNIKGITDFRLEGSRAYFRVDTDMMPEVMNKLNDYSIKYLTCNPPTLEELFMRHYGEDIAAVKGGKRNENEEE